MDRTFHLTGHISAVQADSETQRQPLQVEQLYRRHYRELKVFLMSRTHDREIVEVILQDIYLRLIDIDDLAGIQTPSAYLNRMANNLLIDHQRQQKRRQQRLHEEPVEQLEIPEQKPSLCDQMYYAQQLDLYENILAGLPPPAAEIITLHRIEGLTHKEIAQKFGKSKSWVEKNIAQTLLYCRKILQESGY